MQHTRPYHFFYTSLFALHIDQYFNHGWHGLSADLGDQLKTILYDMQEEQFEPDIAQTVYSYVSWPQSVESPSRYEFSITQNKDPLTNLADPEIAAKVLRGLTKRCKKHLVPCDIASIEKAVLKQFLEDEGDFWEACFESFDLVGKEDDPTIAFKALANLTQAPRLHAKLPGLHHPGKNGFVGRCNPPVLSLEELSCQQAHIGKTYRGCLIDNLEFSSKFSEEPKGSSGPAQTRLTCWVRQGFLEVVLTRCEAYKQALAAELPIDYRHLDFLFHVLIRTGFLSEDQVKLCTNFSSHRLYSLHPYADMSEYKEPLEQGTQALAKFLHTLPTIRHAEPKRLETIQAKLGEVVRSKSLVSEIASDPVSTAVCTNIQPLVSKPATRNSVQPSLRLHWWQTIKQALLTSLPRLTKPVLTLATSFLIQRQK